MRSYNITISKDALRDIQSAADWYDERLPKLGLRFKIKVKQQIDLLQNNANGYSIRYANVRCALIKKFPFLIHFVIDDENHIIEVFAVFHTSRNPEIWTERNNSN